MSRPSQTPYSNLPKEAFWKLAVAGRAPHSLEGLWLPKFQILPQHRVATFGSCFAQHFGPALRSRGFNWLITEEAPSGMSKASLAAYNYNLFTCRTGNIYTASLLRQWVEWALELSPVPDEVWESDGRYFDPFRPAIEPNGFESVEELRASRASAISAFRSAIEQARVLVFTMGLTESWFHKSKGYEYPMCPGTAAGTFDPSEHVFRNQDFDFIRANLSNALLKIRSINKTARIMLTVSPVPLTATNSGQHVLVATMQSKSILRAVAARLSAAPWIDYFPSYEMIVSPKFGGKFFADDERSVTAAGVRFVMDNFFACQEARFGVTKTTALSANAGWPKRLGKSFLGRWLAGSKTVSVQEIACEERLLEAFGSRHE